MNREFKVVLKKIRVSPQKLNIVAKMVRGMKADKAVGALVSCKRRVATDVCKCIKSAIANAMELYGIDSDSLVIKECSVGYGVRLRRYEPRGRGRSGRISKPFSRLNLVVAEVKNGTEG